MVERLGLCDLGADSGQHHLRPEQPRRLRGADERVRDLGVHDLHPSDIEDRHRRAPGGDAVEERLQDLLRPRGVDRADQRDGDHLVGDGNEGRAELTERGPLRLDYLRLQAYSSGV